MTDRERIRRAVVADFNSGISAAQVAARHALPRSAVLGIVHRARQAGRHVADRSGPARTADEALLRQIKWRREGFARDSSHATRAVGRPAILSATDAVLAADLAESGEPAAVVRAAYWGVRG